MFLVLLTLRKRTLRVTRSAPGGHLGAAVREGLVYTLATPTVRVIMVLLVAITGFVIPLTGLLIPLHVRGQAWPGITAGILAGSFGAGLLLSTLLFLIRPYSILTKAPSLAGTALTGAAMLTLPLAPAPEAAAAATLAAGLGTGYFIAKAAPALLTDVPDEYLSRVQGISLFAQTLPMLFTNTIFGWISDSAGAGSAILTAAAGLLLITAGSTFSPAARRL
jgi:hypothetical protein